ncbi:MAG: hypothetical protein WCF79_01555 [Rhodomicrobium sp.]
MSHKLDHLPGECADAALRFGAFGALISGGIVAGQAVSATQRGEKTAQEAVADTLAAATKGGIASAVGGAAAAAVGGHGFSRLASFLLGAATAAWAMSPGRKKQAPANAVPAETDAAPESSQTPAAA